LSTLFASDAGKTYLRFVGKGNDIFYETGISFEIILVCVEEKKLHMLQQI
jgi:hypothetical protein